MIYNPQIFFEILVFVGQTSEFYSNLGLPYLQIVAKDCPERY